MIRLRTLGTIDLRSATDVVFERVLAQPKRLAFLSYLAIGEHAWHRRDKLLALFWPELDDDHARSALRNTLHFLRHELGENVVIARGEDVALNVEAIWCDAQEFVSLLESGDLERGLAVYKGDLLPAMHLSGVIEFERWLDATRDRLRRAASDAARQIATAGAAHGNAEKWLRFILNLFPDDEIAFRDLVQLLDRKGDRAGALREYRAFAQRLSADYDAEPSPESDAVVEAIRNRSGVVGLPTHWSGSEPHDQSKPDAVNGSDHLELRRGGALVHRFPLLASVAVALLVLVSIGGAWVAWERRTPDKAFIQAVIEPFINRTGQPELGSVGQMAAVWIEKAVAQNGLVEVVPVHGLSGRVLKQSALPSGEARSHPVGLNEFRARWLITGSYYLERDTLQLRADVIDLSTGRIRATIGPSAGPRDKPSQAIDSLSVKIVGALTQLTTGNGAEDRSRPHGVVAHPRSPEAVGAFRKGMELFLRDARYDDALQQLNRAYKLDTTDAVPLLEASFVHWTRGEYRTVAALLEKVRPVAYELPEQGRLWLELWDAKLAGQSLQALEINRRLIALVPRSGWELQGGYQALRANRPAEAVKIIESADSERGLLAGLFSPMEIEAEAYHMLTNHRAELNVARREGARFPHLRSARLHEIHALAALGRRGAVEHVLRNARTLSPQSGLAPSLAPRPNLTAGRIALAASMEFRAHGHLSAAQALAEESVDLYSADLVRSQSAIARLEAEQGLASALYVAGRAEEARTVLNRLAEQHPEDVDIKGMLGTLEARQGRRAVAVQIDEQLSRWNGPYLFGRNVVWRARITALLGQKEESVALLRLAFEQGHGFGIDLHRDVDLEGLRDLASYRMLVKPGG